MSANDLPEQMAAAMRSIDSQPGLDKTLRDALEWAMEMVEVCDDAAVSIASQARRIDTPSLTSERLRVADALQVELHEGPMVVELRESDVVWSDDLGHDDRWPRWGPAVARELGVRAVLSLRLFVLGRRLGAITLFSRTGPFTEADRCGAHVLAAYLATAITAATAEDSLSDAMQTRSVIGQAQGILMERFGVDAEQAFEVLRRVSQADNVKLHQVAATLVRTRQTPGTDR